MKKEILSCFALSLALAPFVHLFFLSASVGVSPVTEPNMHDTSNATIIQGEGSSRAQKGIKRRSGYFVA
jgi:hypothetical protein